MADNDQDDDDDKTGPIILDLLTKSLKTIKDGTIDIDIKGQSTLRIEIIKDREQIDIDFINPDVIHLAETPTVSRIGLFDKLKTAKEFSQQLTDNGLTLSFLRKGKEAIILGKNAHPTFSKLITRSDDIQIDSVKESVKLGRGLKE
jgi:hypothetical protein